MLGKGGLHPLAAAGALLLHACFCHWTAMSGLCLSRCHRLSSYVGVSLEPSPPPPAFLCPPLWSQTGSTLVRSPSSLWVHQPPAPLRIVTGPYLLTCCSLCLACSNLFVSNLTKVSLHPSQKPNVLVHILIYSHTYFVKSRPSNTQQDLI